MIDIKIQSVYKFLKKAKWNSFDEFVEDEDKQSAKFFSWYYSENELYVIKENDCKAFYFIHAISPKMAYKKLKERFENE